MKNIKPLLLFIFFFNISINYSQQGPAIAKIKISGTVIEKVSKLPLEYATITFLNAKNPKAKTGGITNQKGEFDIDVVPGVYDIKIEFISFTPIILNQKKLQSSINLGQIALIEDSTQLQEVVVRSATTDIAIKLDKKVYSIGNDLMVKGGTVSDVLDNIPSVAVDADGAVSLRGNSNVKILIDGKPSNAIDLNEALRLIPADALDKVEVITNPSARYDAEGGAGILNIIIKKGKNLGFNGSATANVGIAKNNGISGNLNYKTKKFNLFTTQSYSDNERLGGILINTEYLNPNTDSPNYINQNTDSNRERKGYSGNLGIELYLNDTSSWTNSINYRKSNGTSTDNVYFDNLFFDTSKNYKSTRFNTEDRIGEDFEYNSIFQKKFKKEGHLLTLSAQISNEYDDKLAIILDSKNGTDLTTNIQKENNNLLQADYVLPLGENSQFEAGYRGSFSSLKTDVIVIDQNGINSNYTNKLDYIENVNALYTQYGFKINKFSSLFGLRWEDSQIEVNQLTSSIFKQKKYNNFFPSAFFTYELSDESSLSINYSRRINRPRGRMINPFNNYSSNINIFHGNPDLDPAMTNSFDLGYLTKWSKFIVSTSIYTNKTTDVFQIITTESGEFVNDVPVILMTPINLATESRTGFEFNLNYTPYKWWRLNSNFNFYNIITSGDYTYTDSKNVVVNQNFDNNTNSWSTKLTSKVTLPKIIDWQTNFNYNGDEKTAQGKSIGVFYMNTGISKDLFKDKATIAFNISDVFNSRKRKTESLIPDITKSYSEMQFGKTQYTLSFTYRFNKQKSEKEKPSREDNGGGEDF